MRSLGWLRFALPSASNDQGRVFALHELVLILRKRGAPVLRDQLTAELRKKTSFNEFTIRVYLARCSSCAPLISSACSTGIYPEARRR